MRRPGAFVVGHRAHSPDVVARHVAAGVAYVEIDVRVVGGRAVATHHLPVRWTRGVLERDTVRFRARRGPAVDPTVDEVIGGLPPGVRIVFDPKDREPELRARLVGELVAAVDEPARHVVSTRSRCDIEMFAAAGFGTWLTLDTPEQIRRATGRPLTADGVTVRHRALTAGSVSALHTVTDTVVAWTVRTVPRAHELVSHGVDGITTHDLHVMAALRR